MKNKENWVVVFFMNTFRLVRIRGDAILRLCVLYSTVCVTLSLISSECTLSFVLYSLQNQNNDFLKFISLGKLSCSLPLFQGCWWILPKQVIIAEFVYFQWVACVSKVLFMGKMSCRENAIRPRATFLLAEPMRLHSTKILQSC